jgi:hypothetical protein
MASCAPFFGCLGMAEMKGGIHTHGLSRRTADRTRMAFSAHDRSGFFSLFSHRRMTSNAVLMVDSSELFRIGVFETLELYGHSLFGLRALPGRGGCRQTLLEMTGETVLLLFGQRLCVEIMGEKYRRFIPRAETGQGVDNNGIHPALNGRLINSRLETLRSNGADQYCGESAQHHTPFGNIL